jgi:hypothetical protein
METILAQNSYLVFITVLLLVLSVVVFSFPSSYKSIGKTYLRSIISAGILFLSAIMLNNYSGGTWSPSVKMDGGETSNGLLKFIFYAFLTAFVFLSFPKYRSQKHHFIRVLLLCLFILLSPLIF